MDTERMSDQTPETEIALPDVEGAHRLPSGGYAVLRPASMLTGSHVKRVRTALNSDGDGDITNIAIGLLLACVVVDWQIPGVKELAPPSMANPWQSLDRLPIDDFLALEEVVKPVMRRVLGMKAEAAPGTPDPQ
jgi:hypothetical protein